METRRIIKIVRDLSGPFRVTKGKDFRLKDVDPNDTLEKNRDIFRFFQHMIAFRKARPWIARSRYWREDVHWYAANGQVDFASRTLAYCLHGGSDLYVMINAFWEPLQFHIQEGKNWKRVVDTSRQDFVEERISSLDYEVAPRSVVVLEGSS